MELVAFRKVFAKLKAARARLERLMDSSAVATSITDGLPRAKATTSAVERAAVELADATAEFERLSAEAVQALADLFREVNRRVAGRPGDVLILRYGALMTFAEISAELNLSQAQVYKLHRDGVAIYGSSAVTATSD